MLCVCDCVCGGVCGGMYVTVCLTVWGSVCDFYVWLCVFLDLCVAVLVDVPIGGELDEKDFGIFKSHGV